MDGSIAPAVPPDTGSGCHGGRDTMVEAARAAGKSAAMDRLMLDYTRGQHYQPK